FGGRSVSKNAFPITQPSSLRKRAMGVFGLMIYCLENMEFKNYEVLIRTSRNCGSVKVPSSRGKAPG
ncbi:MAG: hypothetical protein ACK47R_20755, partial [Planctomycetia bacterium]